MIDSSHPSIDHILKESNDILPYIRLAEPGTRIVYYEGYLNVATLFDLRNAETWQKDLLFLAGEIYKMAMAGDIHLYQKKKSDWNYIYYAEKAKEDWKKQPQYLAWIYTLEAAKKCRTSPNNSSVINPRSGRPSLRLVASGANA